MPASARTRQPGFFWWTMRPTNKPNVRPGGTPSCARNAARASSPSGSGVPMPLGITSKRSSGTPAVVAAASAQARALAITAALRPSTNRFSHQNQRGRSRYMPRTDATNRGGWRSGRLASTVHSSAVNEKACTTS